MHYVCFKKYVRNNKYKTQYMSGIKFRTSVCKLYDDLHSK